MTDEQWMRRALNLARRAADRYGEVPVGAVIVRNGQLVATGYNQRETGKNAVLHAELTAIRRACRKLGGWRLHECDLYVTLEPCPMCAGAIINARIRRVIVGAMDHRFGAMGSVCNLTEMPFNHRPEVAYGVLQTECTEVLQNFFRTLRNKKKQERGTTMKPMTKGVHHIALKAKGLEQYHKTVSFYHEILGMPVVRTWGSDEKVGIMLDSGAGMLEIFANAPDELGAGALRHLAFDVEDVDACIEAVRAAGYTVTIEPKDIVFASEPPYHARIAFCIGPVGEEVEFFKGE